MPKAALIVKASVKGATKGRQRLRIGQRAEKAALDRGCSKEYAKILGYSAIATSPKRVGRTMGGNNVDKAFVASFDLTCDDNASRVMLPRERGSVRPYGFKVCGSNTKKGGSHYHNRKKADRLHETHEKREARIRLETKLHNLDTAIAALPPCRKRRRLEAKREHTTHLITRMGI